MADLFDFEGIDSKERNPFEKFGLKKNPFPSKAISSPKIISPFVSIDLTTIKKLEIFIKDSVASQKWGGIPLIGSYGSGKTRLLLELEQNISQKLSKGGHACAYYVSNPGENIFDFFSNVINAINLGQLIDLLYNSLKSDVDNIILGNLQKDPSLFDNSSYSIKNEDRIISALVQLFKSKGVLDESDLGIAAAFLLMNHGISILNNEQERKIKTHEDFINKLRASEMFLSGYTLNKSEMNLLKLKSESISEEDIFKYIFPFIINIHKLAGFKILFILLDEFEHIIGGSKSRITLFLNNFRALIDANLMNFSMIIACVIESWFEATNLNPGFEERFLSPIELPPIQEDSAKNLIKEYSNIERINEEDKGSLVPFEDSGIKVILEKSEYNIRKFIEFCHEVLLKAAYENSKKIDKGFVERFF